MWFFTYEERPSNGDVAYCSGEVSSKYNYIKKFYTIINKKSKSKTKCKLKVL